MPTTTRVRAHSRDGAAAAGWALEREAFQHFPYALLVVGRGGELLARNLASAALIEAVGLPDTQLTCCALLGCRAPESVLADTCVTELTLRRREILPEIRVDIAARGGTTAVWVAAAPLDRDASRVVIQLRPGVANDRRRRTDPHWLSEPRLRIRTLGRTVVESAEGPIGGDWLEQRTGQLLKYLVAERHRVVQVDEIGESIWPRADFAVGGSVRYYVHALRRRIEPQRGRRERSAFVVSHAGGYRLNLDRVEVDADELEAHTTAGLALAKVDPERATAEIEQGLALYRGDFLAELPYAEWAMTERHRLHDLVCMGLRSLANLRLEEGLVDDAARWLERLGTLQPYDEEVHRRLIELDIARGRRSDAVRRYDVLRSRMRRTFGQNPSFTLADLTPTRARSHPLVQPASSGGSPSRDTP
jgi:DNA-binding SARP family transcriptional activator